MNEPHIERQDGAFRFKRFTIRQDRCPMKVGTDGVLLGAWTGLRTTDRRMLDIGTGTGLIALMLAQRAPGARITGIDIDDVSQARENAAASPWGDRLYFEQTPVQTFRPAERYDLIVSNPPFYVDSLTCPDAGRTAARHTVHLSYEELVDSVVRLLAPGGRFAVVLPTPESEHFRHLASARLLLTHLTRVRTTPRRSVRRVLMEFYMNPAPGAISAATAATSLAVPTTPTTPTSPAAATALAAPIVVTSSFTATAPTVPTAATSPTTPTSPAAATALAASIAPTVSAVSAVSTAATSLAVPTTPTTLTAAITDPTDGCAGPFPLVDELTIGTGEHESYTPEYRALTRDFYLKF